MLESITPPRQVRLLELLEQSTADQVAGITEMPSLTVLEARSQGVGKAGSS